MGIQFKDVSFMYQGIKENYDALSHVNLNIDEDGEFIAIIGHTGSGKSTLVQHMNALLLPTSGKVNVLGQELPPHKKEKINHLRQKVGLVFQFPEYQLFEETILKDIMFGPKKTLSRLKKKLLRKLKRQQPSWVLIQNFTNNHPLELVVDKCVELQSLVF